MLGRVTTSFLASTLALVVLSVSIVRTIGPKYVFSQTPKLADEITKPRIAGVDYYLAFPGVLPDSFLWPLKVLRDRIWIVLTRDPLKKSEIYLLLADKRLAASSALIEGGKYELGVSTLTKAEKYLESAVSQERLARGSSAETGQFLEKLALASLKHREVLEEIILKVPEDAKPVVNQTLDYSKKAYEETSHGLAEVGRPIPLSPFVE